MTTTTTTNLRDALLAALGRLPGTRRFHVHVLVSVARKHAGLFPFATPRPRVYVQDILVLVSEEDMEDGSGRRRLVAGLEAHVYTVPSTESGILYISKVDSTGQGVGPAPTSCVARTVIGFYADARTRALGDAVRHMWVHLFARAQGQYLFPNSAEYEGKRVLSDVRLCVWWKRVIEDVEKGLRDGGTGTARLYYVLPGYGEMEAVHALKLAGGPASNSTWIYGHPYGETEIGLPCPGGSDGDRHLGQFIPSFDDDPKSRFMDEIAYTTETPRRKRKRAETQETDDGVLGELRKVSTDEFWERMSFRQECVAGAVTGFFTLGITSTSQGTAQRGLVGPQVLKRVLTTLTTHVEFSSVEGGVRGTEVVEGAIGGLCEGSDMVYGTVGVRNEGRGAGGGTKMETVRVLAARKKNRK